jgi:hypothetical protein
MVVTAVLNISYQSPENQSSQTIRQNVTFPVIVNVSCLNAPCGNVTGLLRYNATSANPDTIVSNTTGATPFYVTGENSVYCGAMNASDVCSLNFTVKASGNPGSSAKFDVNFSSTSSSVSLPSPRVFDYLIIPEPTNDTAPITVVSTSSCIISGYGSIYSPRKVVVEVWNK